MVLSPRYVHDAIGGDDDAAAQLVALMDQGLQQCAGVVKDGACEEQIVQHEEIAVDDGLQPDLALRRGVQGVVVEEVVGLKILDLVALQDRLIGNRLGDVGLPGARFADPQGVLAGGNERQGVELDASWRGNLGLKDQSNSASVSFSSSLDCRYRRSIRRD